jgi:phenylacetate-CoA ligase
LIALNMYGLAEIIGPGVAAECAAGQDGSHIQEDHFLPEIIDPASGEPMPPGREGELVLTTLTKEALPLVRYRTGDATSLGTSPCPCGRTTVRMSPVRRRYDDMLVIRGVNVYPSEIERILLSTSNVAPHYQIVIDRAGNRDNLTVMCEPARNGDDVDSVQAGLQQTLHDQLGISIAVRFVESGVVPRSAGKAIRVVDRRFQ